jgi:hypothetical protein
MYQFKTLPLEIQLEILKYQPNFRRVNKLYYVKGKQIFEKFYLNIPISKKEYLQTIKECNNTTIIYNNMSISICNNPHFWKEKMINDDIPMIYKVVNINDYI